MEWGVIEKTEREQRSLLLSNGSIIIYRCLSPYWIYAVVLCNINTFLPNLMIEQLSTNSESTRRSLIKTQRSVTCAHILTKDGRSINHCYIRSLQGRLLLSYHQKTCMSTFFLLVNIVKYRHRHASHKRRTER